METDKAKSNRCAACHRELDLGVDVVCVEEGVIDPRGIVPLKGPLLFCSEECVAGHFSDDSQVEQLSKRIP